MLTHHDPEFVSSNVQILRWPRLSVATISNEISFILSPLLHELRIDDEFEHCSPQMQTSHLERSVPLPTHISQTRSKASLICRAPCLEYEHPGSLSNTEKLCLRYVEV
jgi:hypothetical protein